MLQGFAFSFVSRQCLAPAAWQSEQQQDMPQAGIHVVIWLSEILTQLVCRPLASKASKVRKAKLARRARARTSRDSHKTDKVEMSCLLLWQPSQI